MDRIPEPPSDGPAPRRPSPLGGILWALALLAACGPDDQPLRTELDSLRKQLARQESLITSLQEGTKVMQQQIDLLNRELREARQATERAEAARTALAERLAAQATENRRLAADAKLAADRRARAEQSLHVEEKGGQVEEIPRPLAAVSKAAAEVLARHGYSVKVSVNTEQRAVFVTERKMTAPASLEVPGLRNQYLLSLRSLPSRGTRLIVKAEFEKITPDGARPAGGEETTEVERRLIAEIVKALGPAGKT